MEQQSYTNWRYWGWAAAAGTAVLGGLLYSRGSSSTAGITTGLLGVGALSYMAYTQTWQSTPTRTIVFVLGGPGAGKGTQCARLAESMPIAHFSAGDLLRAHCKSGSKEGQMVADMIKQGQIVPAEVTINLLEAAMQKAMKEQNITRFLIDGFPRTMDNRDSFERLLKMDCSFVLFFDCPQEVMEKRILGRNEGRVDDNLDTLRRRFKVFEDQTMPVVEYYEKHGKLRRVNADRPADEVFADAAKLFQ